MNIGAQKYTADGLTADVNAAVAAKETLRVLGYHVSESAGLPATATVKIVEGATVAGATGTIATINLAASGTATAAFGGKGVDSRGGVSIDVVAGEVDIAVFYENR